MPKFACKVSRTETQLDYHLRGVIDEDARFDIPETSGIEAVVVDFSNIKGINSCGVRNWLNFLKRMPEKGVQYTYRGCHPMVLDQIGMMPHFTKPGTKFERFFLIYKCAACDFEKEYQIEGREIPTKSCEKCEKNTFVDDLDVYEFLTEQAG